MEFWENTILQWINCLNNSHNSIKTIEELQDGKIYYNLINKIVPWNSKKSFENQRNMVLKFLRDEYPNFPLKNENTAINNLCIASLVLSRLSFEPIFHEMLCKNVDDDMQTKIKSVLETVYSLDKSITEEDLYNVFSLSSKKDRKLLHTEPKFILDEFLENSVAVDDNIQLEQTRQIRQLKVQIETMGYENSDLVEDIAAQNRQIKELTKKLQEALSELRTIHADCSKLSDTTSFEPKDKKDLESIYQRKLKSLEKYANELQTDNNQLQDEKKTLNIKVKQLYMEKYRELKEKNENKKKEIESVILTKSQENQIKDLQNKLQEALSELKMERVNNSKLNYYNFSKEANDRKAVETAHLNKESLENSVKSLKSKNYQLKQEKYALIDEVKLYKKKHYILKEKNEINETTIKSMSLSAKTQERQIKDLKNKLQEASSKLKTNNLKVNSSNSNIQKKNNKIVKQ